MVRPVVRAPRLPWFSIDAECVIENGVDFPTPKMSEVEKCMSCTRTECNNCLSSRKSHHGTGRPVGRPRKNRTPIDGQISINTAAISAAS